MGAGRAQLFAGLCGVGMWAAWVLPALQAHPRPAEEAQLVALWTVHMLPLVSLLFAPVLGRELTYLGIFPAAMVLPVAGSVLFDWPLGRPLPQSDLVLGGAAFFLYAVSVSLMLRRARVRQGEARSERLAAPAREGSTVASVLGTLRGLAGGLVPLVLAYGAHFDRRVQLLLEDSFAGAAGYARVFVDLAALGLGILAADFALFSPLRSARRRSGLRELATLAEQRFGPRSAPRFSAGASFALSAVLLFLLGGYLAVRS